jgi:hypothetical protein
MKSKPVSPFFKAFLLYLVVLILALAAALLFPSKAHALEWAHYEAEGTTIVLFTEPCAHDGLTSYLKETSEVKDIVVQTASVSYLGTTFPACYYMDGAKIVLADVTGNAGYIMLDQFKRQSL